MSSDLPTLPARPSDSHKGTCGTVSIIGGSADARSRMVGAPVLAALAALRTGAGLARLVMPDALINAGLTMCPSAIGMAMPTGPDGVEPHIAAEIVDDLTETSNVLAIGPGLGTSPGARAATLRSMQQERIPVVMDADAINSLADIPEFFRDFHAAAILTPHPGEFKRLCAAMGLKQDLNLNASRSDACEQMAQRLGRIVVLKGSGTVVSDGHRTWTCTHGHPCLATAGTGDVLAGIIAGLVAQFSPSINVMLARARAPQLPLPTDRPLDLFDAARLGVLIHALASERWAADHAATGGLLATDLLDFLPTIVEQFRVR